MEFAEWCTAHGVRLLLTFPAYSRVSDVDTEFAKTFMARLVAGYRKLGVPVIGRPEDFYYDPTWFWDTRYHLKPEYAEISTMQRIAELRRFFVRGDGHSVQR
jgi:hypothetical protein